MLYLILEKEEERTVAYTRLKYNRKMGIQETPTFKIWFLSFKACQTKNVNVS